MIFGVWLASGISPYPSTCAVPSHKAARLVKGGRLVARCPPRRYCHWRRRCTTKWSILIEFPVGIPRPEIVPPAANDERQFRDGLLHILPALSRPSVLAYTIPEFLRRLRAWPSLHKMPARVALDASFLANRTSQEYEALLPVSQVHQPRLRGMQSQSEPFHHQPDPPERFPGRRFRPAQSHEILAISDQDSKLAACLRRALDRKDRKKRPRRTLRTFDALGGFANFAEVLFTPPRLKALPFSSVTRSPP